MPTSLPARLRSAVPRPTRPPRRGTPSGPQRDAAGNLVPGVLPDFLVIGAMKSGTTSLHAYLRKHPRVFASRPKEVHFFDRRRYAQGVDWYRAHFPVARRGPRRWVAGETSPSYLYHPRAPERAAGVVGDARIIVLLRDPVARALSHWAWRHHVQGKEPRDLAEAMERCERVEREGGRTGRLDATYLSRGRYAEQLERWWKHFPRERSLVLHTADLGNNTPRVLARVQRFLGVPVVDLPAAERFYVGASSRVVVDPALREHLRAYFAPHNARLYDLLGYDLGWDAAHAQGQRERTSSR